MTMLFGEKSNFALECELENPLDEFFNCKICLWADGEQIGNYERGSSLRVSASFFRDTLRFVSELHDEALDGKSAEAVLKFIYKKLYEVPEEDVSIEELEHHWQRYGKFLICPDGGPAFDGWLAVLLLEPIRERFLWRYALGAARESFLPVGRYEATVSSFLAWADRMMQD